MTHKSMVIASGKSPAWKKSRSPAPDLPPKGKYRLCPYPTGPVASTSCATAKDVACQTRTPKKAATHCETTGMTSRLVFASLTVRQSVSRLDFVAKCAVGAFFRDSFLLFARPSHAVRGA